MPSENTITITMTDDAATHVERIAAKARRAGQPFPTYTAPVKGPRGGKLGTEERVRLSPIVHRALAHAAETLTFGPKAAPAPTVADPDASPDAARLRAAMARAGLTSGPEVARAVGCNRSTVYLVLKETLALDVAAGGDLLAWVESIERG